MPRFGPPLDFSPPETTPPIRTPLQARSHLERVDESVCLSCLSPDGRSVHSLSFQRGSDAVIESHSLPLLGTTADQQRTEREVPVVVRTTLPQVVQSTLALEPPLELMCVDGDSPSPSPHRDPYDLSDSASLQPTASRRHLPLLCLYTRKSVYLLQFAFAEKSSYDPSSPVQGEVISVTEPFESYLLDASSSTDIIRIRPAPQRRMGFATMCPPGSMAMLTSEHALVLYHGPRGKRRDEARVTKPLTFGLEELADGENLITDFVFCQSTELPLLSSISVLLLKASGAVLGASGVLFHGAVVPRTLVQESVHFLESEVERLEDPALAKWRQCKAALRLLENAFGQPDTPATRKGHFVEAHVQSRGSVEDATTWPIQLQGPLLTPSDPNSDDSFNDAMIIENIFSKGLVGIVIGRANGAVDFAVISPTSLLPRFEFEDEEDQVALDDSLFDSGVVLERVSVQPDDNETSGSLGKPGLIQDLVVDSMVHFVSRNGVATISTNAMYVASNKVRLHAEGTEAGDSRGFLSPPTSGSKPVEEQVKTSAWWSAQVSPTGVSGRARLVGAVVSGDVQFGHVLLVRLSNGSMDAISLTESRLLHESSTSIFHEESVPQTASREVAAAEEALDAVNATRPLVDLIDPLVKQVVDGVSGMGKIVGGETAPHDITPVELAMAISVIESCENNIVLPMNELNQITARRMEALREIHENQVVQIEHLKDMVRILKERMASTEEKLRKAKSTAANLSERSSGVLEASHAMQPTVTDAELDYFAYIKRLDGKCAEWEKKSKALEDSCANFCDSLDPGKSKFLVELPNDQITNCHALLNGQAILLEREGTALKETKANIQEFAATAGLGILEEATSDEQLYGSVQ